MSGMYWNLFNYSLDIIKSDFFKIFARVVTPGINISIHISLHVGGTSSKIEIPMYLPLLTERIYTFNVNIYCQIIHNKKVIGTYISPDIYVIVFKVLKSIRYIFTLISYLHFLWSDFKSFFSIFTFIFLTTSKIQYIPYPYNNVYFPFYEFSNMHFIFLLNPLFLFFGLRVLYMWGIWALFWYLCCKVFEVYYWSIDFMIYGIYSDTRILFGHTNLFSKTLFLK